MIEKLKQIAQDRPRIAGARIAAAIVHKNSVFWGRKYVFGCNSIKSHPFQKQYGHNESAIFLHAEVDAIKNAIKHIDSDWALSDCTLYIARMKYKDQTKKVMIPGLAKPCVGCQRAIATFDIKHVCYTTDEGIEWL